MSEANVFQLLLADIVSGKYGPGVRLPSERDLAKVLGASRPTIREALKRLEQWNLVTTRRGSGVTVRDVRRDATLDVLPAYLRFGAVQRGPEEVARLIADILRLRRGLVLETLRTLAGRVAAGSLAQARAAVAEADRARGTHAFVRADFRVLREVFAAAGFLPGQWLLNSIEGIYLEMATLVSAPGVIPDDYRAAHEASFAALESGDGEKAARALGAYLDTHDSRVLAALGITRSQEVRHAG